MSTIYADTSALVGAYLPDERDHDALRTMLLEGDQKVVTSELALVEFAGAARSAERAGRIRRAGPLLARLDVDCQSDGPIALLRLRPETVLPTARDLILAHRLGTLDALHLAVAVEETPAIVGGDPLVFVTRDAAQASAAASLGFAVA